MIEPAAVFTFVALSFKRVGGGIPDSLYVPAVVVNIQLAESIKSQKMRFLTAAVPHSV